MQQQVPQLRFAITRLASGPRLHYAEQGDPGGEPILFLPAYTDSWFSYSRVLPLVPPHYHAYALDQRGHGDSERPDCCYAVEDFAADVVAFLDAVGAERATLVGHSASCLVARHVAEAQPPARSLCRDLLGGLAAAISRDPGGGIFVAIDKDQASLATRQCLRYPTASRRTTPGAPPGGLRRPGPVCQRRPWPPLTSLLPGRWGAS